MAAKRMFALSIIDSDLFLDMPMTSQALYFHLAMRADDDGFVDNPQKIKRSVGASDDDMKLLIAKQFIILFESGIVVIKHWRLHNYLRPDRYKPTIYQDEKSQLTLDNNVYLIGIPTDDQLATVGIPSDNQLATQRRVEKNREEKVRKIESSGEVNELDSSATAPPKKSKRHKFGEYNHVLLTDEQHSRLIDDFGTDTVSEYVKRVDEYVQMKGKPYKDYNLTIRNWISEDGKGDKNEAGHTRDNHGGKKEKFSSKYATVL